MNNKKKRLMEIEHPYIKEIEEHTEHPGVDEERDGDLVQHVSDEENLQAEQAQG
ncbi:hypothetical protein ACTWQL_02110 [Pseudalkalibacillus sp. R45]|uniref:hypothetical protein n=1 Tax=Pseudalkalibacillus sp. R45 TaxID=3457433 RepID=UPI003FCE9A5D